MGQPDYRNRATELLNRASIKIKAACDTMHADHAAKGHLRSGATIIRAVEIWSEITTDHLKIALAEFGATIDTRARQWKRAMQGAQGALNLHSAAAADLLEPSFRLAGAKEKGNGSAMRAADGLIQDAHARMSAVIADYRDGWTAPRAKKWNERHPMIYALLMAGIGAALAIAGRLIVT